MSAEASLLHSITRSKLYESVSSKDHCSLHRWVLLKNSILSTSTQSDITVSEYPEVTPNSNEEPDEEEELAEEEIGSVAIDSFMFPDARNFVSDQVAHNSEAEWLDSLLETLAEDEDDDFPSDSDVHASALPVDEDDDQLLSPSVSPLASSEDLPQSRFFTSLSVPYANNFSPFHSSSPRNYDVSASLNKPTSSFSSIAEDPLPYHDPDDIEDSSVPDAIEDMSDDESDTLSTPSFGRSINSLFLDTSASPSPSIDRNTLSFKHSPHPKPLHLDPLPFADAWSHHAFYSTD
jgi:hypothetical protein